MSYKIKIRVTKENPDHRDVSELIASIKASLQDNDFHLMISAHPDAVGDLSTPYDNLIHSSLKAHLPEGSDIRYGEVGHEYGMGGTYGSGYTIYLPQDLAPAIYLETNYLADGPCAYISTEAWLETVLDPVPHMQAAYDKFVEAHEDSLWELEYIAEFIESIGWHRATGGNSYNHENDLDSEIDFIIATQEEGADYIYGEHTLLFVRVHQGGDVRGNYSGVRVYRYSEDHEAGFFEYTVGWSLHDAVGVDGHKLSREDCQAIDEKWEPGYSSNPSYRASKDIETIELLDDKSGYLVTLKSGVRGKIYPTSYVLNY